MKTQTFEIAVDHSPVESDYPNCYAVIPPNGRLLRFLHTGDAATAAELLRAMVEAGFPVASFARRRQSLEDVFMQVTKGLVQ